MDELTIENILKYYKPLCHDIVNCKKQNFINHRIKKIFIINLVDNVIRRNYILILMKKYKINFSLVVVSRISDKIYAMAENTKITKEELGCTLSHMWCLKQIIKNNYENAIIFEDDIIFHKNFKSMFMNIFQKDYDFLLLGACDFSFQSLNKDMLKNNSSSQKDHKIDTTRVKIDEKLNQIIQEPENKGDTLHLIDKEFSSSSSVPITNTTSIDMITEKISDNSSVNSDTTITNIQKTNNGNSILVKIDIPKKTVPTFENLYRPHENSVKVYGAHANYYSLKGARAMYHMKNIHISFFDKDYMQMFDKFDNAFICYPNLVVTDISTSNIRNNYCFFSKAEELYYINCFDKFSFTDYNFIYLDIILKHKGVKIKENDTYETYMNRLIKYQFSNNKERDTIKNRIVMDFFTIQELEKIKLNI